MNENVINSYFDVLIDYGELIHSCSKVCLYKNAFASHTRF